MQCSPRYQKRAVSVDFGCSNSRINHTRSKTGPKYAGIAQPNTKLTSTRQEGMPAPLVAVLVPSIVMARNTQALSE
jgi:hypothetical protein